MKKYLPLLILFFLANQIHALTICFGKDKGPPCVTIKLKVDVSFEWIVAPSDLNNDIKKVEATQTRQRISPNDKNTFAAVSVYNEKTPLRQPVGIRGNDNSAYFAKGSAVVYGKNSFTVQRTATLIVPGSDYNIIVPPGTYKIGDDNIQGWKWVKA